MKKFNCFLGQNLLNVLFSICMWSRAASRVHRVGNDNLGLKTEGSFKTVTITEFDSFGNIDVFEVLVPQLTVQENILLKTWRSAACPVTDVILHLQHGSYPLFEVTNKTLPSTESGYYLHRSQLQKFVLSSNGSYSIRMPTPLPGSWFLSAYVFSTTSETIHKITDKDCSYFLQLSTKSIGFKSVQELRSDVPTDVVLNSSSPFTVFRFWIGGNIWHYNVKLTNCSSDQTELCPVTLLVRSGAPSMDGSQSSYKNCTNTPIEASSKNTCVLSMSSPEVEMWQYVTLEISGSTHVSLSLQVAIKDSCSKEKDEIKVSHLAVESQIPYVFKQNNSSILLNIDNNKPLLFNTTIMPQNPEVATLNTTENDLYKGDSLNMSKTEQEACVSIKFFFRSEDIQNVFATKFYPHNGGMLKIVQNVPSVYRFDLSSQKDIGGLLLLILEPKGFQIQADIDLNIKVCIQKGSIPFNGSGLYCKHSERDLFSFGIQGKKVQHLRLIYPYPEPGPWFAGMLATCFNKTSKTKIPCPGDTLLVKQTMEIAACPECSNEGYCTQKTKAFRALAYCKCRAKYSGYTCNDDTGAVPPGTQKMYTYFLTLSNLFFIPAIILALYRRYFVEALVYTTNMFFSTFYHACDMGPWSQYMYCIMPYHVLIFSDFLLSLLSFWVTLMALAELPPTLLNIFQVSGCIGVALTLTYQPTGFLGDALPLSIGFGIVLLSWIIRCVKYKSFYPRKWRWCLLVPGMLLAGTGLSMFVLVENDANYPYTHSVWHICVSVCILFILPRGKQRVDCSDVVNDSSSNSTYIELENTAEDNGPKLLSAVGHRNAVQASDDDGNYLFD